MGARLLPDPYHNSIQKRVFDLGLALFAVIFFAPLSLIISVIIKLTSSGPILFTQKRVGKSGKVFRFIKFRTMNESAERQQKRLRHLNEADGPVFKIRDDPRFTRIGKLLARTGLDELPQLINVLKGEMSLVGPRPLPVNEARKLSQSQKIRELIKPGITSTWVIRGTHNLSFREWMRLDKQYALKASLRGDIEILFKTLLIVLRLLSGHVRVVLKAHNYYRE